MDMRLRRSGLLLGFGFGGFFDGILLHQVLQWHHLLSSVAGAWAADLRHQVLADGLFHAVMYVVAATGLVIVIRHRAELARSRGPRRFSAAFLTGFGLWHATDAVLSHWLFQLHHIRMNVESPFAWDVGWLLIFGVIPLGLGWLFERRDRPVRPEPRALLPLILIGATLIAAVAAGMPPPGASGRIVVLADGTPSSVIFKALAASDARIVSGDRSGRLWHVAGASWADALSLYRHGALYVSGTVTPAGCAAWSRS